MRIQRKRGQDGGEGSGDRASKPGGRTRTASIGRKPRSHGPDAGSGPAAEVARRSGPDGTSQRAEAWPGEAAHAPYEAMAGISPNLGAMIQRAAQGGGTTIDDVATAAVENRGAGKALDGEVRRQVEPHLGADLSGVRVHADKDAAAASSAIGARAFAYRSDVFLGEGESPTDVKLMAHELTHVVQQGAAAQAQRKVAVGAANDPAEAEADGVAERVAAGPPKQKPLIIDDGQPVAPGQMTRSAAIARLRAAAGPDGGATVEQLIAEHGGDSTAQLEAAACNLLGGGKPATADELVGSLVAKLQTGGAGAGGEAAGAAPQPGSDLASVGAGTAAAKPTAAGLVQRLGDGAPLDAGMAAAAGEAYGMDLSGVRVHTGPAAARAASEHNARAFTVGSHVAFGAGEYNPGTVVGDAIMAHELAHVAQQDGADAAVQRKPLEDGTASAEGEADAAAGGVLARLYGVMRKTTAGVAGQLKGKTDLALQRCPGGTPDRVPDLGGAQHKEWSVDDFIAVWEKKQGRKMTDEEKQILAHGCIGITALNLGRGNHNPPLGLSFSSFEQARKVQAAVNDIVKAKPAADKLGEMIAANPQLADLKNVLAAMPADPDPTKWRAYVFSKRFFSRQTGTWEERKNGDPTKFQPDKNGQVDMTDDHNVGRADVDEGPGNYMINFDYGWYDEESGSWLHANHAEPDMKVYQSTLEYYSRPLRNFDRQVFCVAFARVGK